MRCLGVTHEGIEDIAAQEIGELISSNPEIITSGIIFEADYTGLCTAAYRAQSLRRIGPLLASIPFTELSSFNHSGNIETGDWLRGKTFALRCQKVHDCELSTQEIEHCVGGAIKDCSGSKVDLINPDVLLHALVTHDHIHLCVDFSGFDMSKRDYNIFSVQRSLKGDIAYALFRLADTSKESIFLDPFSGSGGIAIEAALFSIGKSPHFYSKERFYFHKYDLGIDTEDHLGHLDKIVPSPSTIWALEPTLHYLNSSKKNAKIAGADKAIRFSRVDTDWLDLKFDRVDGVASFLSKEHHDHIDQLFLRLSTFLNGKVVLVSDGEEALRAAIAHGLTLTSERTIYQGKTPLAVKIFEKSL